MGKLMADRSLKTKSDVEGFVSTAQSRQIVIATKLVEEWNRENPTNLIDPTVLYRNPNLQGPSDQQYIRDRFPVQGTGPSQQQQAAARVLSDLAAVVLAFIKRPCDFTPAFLPCTPEKELTDRATKLLSEIKYLLDRPERIDIDSTGISPAVQQYCSAYTQLRDRSLPPADLQVLVYREAVRLVGTSLPADPNFATCVGLYRSGKVDQLKGLVGEYLGLLAAERHLATSLKWTRVFNGLFMIEVRPTGGKKLPGTNEAPEPHSAPQLSMQGDPAYFGTPVGEIDRLLCIQTGTQYQPVLALECKGGENSTNLVEQQMKTMTNTFKLIAANPQVYCLASRSGNEYIDLNHLYDLNELAKAKVMSTGPDRRKVDYPFDISLGITSEQMDSLLVYLANNPPDQWGQPPLGPAPTQTPN